MTARALNRSYAHGTSLTPLLSETIADEFDVTASELRKWNHLKADHLVRGTSLRIYPGGTLHS